MHSFRAQKVVENATHWKKIKIRFKGLPFQAFLPSLAFLPCPETVLIEIAAKNYFHFTFLSWPSVQALAMVLFISSSPSSYIFFIMSISPALGSLEVSGFGSMALLLESAATYTDEMECRLWKSASKPSLHELCDSTCFPVWPWQ